MTDVLTPAQRRLCMSHIRGKDAKTRTYCATNDTCNGLSLSPSSQRIFPGKPDLTFPRLKKAILVHGCFWHMHSCRYGRVKPATNPAFWESKRLSNKKRDAIKRKELQRLGWSVLVIWECRTKDLDKLSDRIYSFLNDN